MLLVSESPFQVCTQSYSWILLGFFTPATAIFVLQIFIHEFVFSYPVVSTQEGNQSFSVQHKQVTCSSLTLDNKRTPKSQKAGSAGLVFPVLRGRCSALNLKSLFSIVADDRRYLRLHPLCQVADASMRLRRHHFVCSFQDSYIHHCTISLGCISRFFCLRAFMHALNAHSIISESFRRSLDELIPPEHSDRDPHALSWAFCSIVKIYFGRKILHFLCPWLPPIITNLSLKSGLASISFCVSGWQICVSKTRGC